MRNVEPQTHTGLGPGPQWTSETRAEPPPRGGLGGGRLTSQPATDEVRGGAASSAHLTVQQGGDVTENLLQVPDAGLQPDHVPMASLDLVQRLGGEGRAHLEEKLS